MNEHNVRQLWLALILLASSIVGISGGVLAYLDGAHIARAVMTGGASFAGAATFFILLLTILTRGEKA